jgi:hypothetical protein
MVASMNMIVVVNITCLGVLQFSMGTMVLTRMTVVHYFPTPLEWDLQGSDSLPGLSHLDWKDSRWQGAVHLEVLYLIILCTIIMEGF